MQRETLKSLKAPEDFPSPAPHIFDATLLRAEIGSLAAEADDAAELRKAVTTLLRQAHKAGMAEIAAAFTDAPREARPVTRNITWLTDQIVTLIWEVATTYLHPNSTPTQGERLAVIATGGYGRGEMAPQSDVDLLFLTPTKVTGWAESVIESMLYMLWDLRLKVGHASRTAEDCVRLGAEDHTIRTALLEHRFVAGDAALAGELDELLWTKLFAADRQSFVAAKLEERDARHEKQGGQRYMVEPNVKEGKGGLRDLQSLFWIAKYVHQAHSVRELVNLGVFRPEEWDLFAAAENFLWAVRCHLHLVAGRPVEQLTFDMQVEVARRMQYIDRPGRRGVEVFMQDYFRHATAVGDLTRIFLTSLEASQTKEAPLLERIFRRRRKVREGYEVTFNRLAIKDDTVFLVDKMNLLGIFDEALRTGLLIHPDAMRLVRANLHLIDDEMRASSAAQKLFLSLLLKHGNPERALRRMNELGVLSAFLPEFEPIVAMMQFNMYHHYTVDEHTIQVISQLAQLERGELEEELPVVTGILRDGINRRLLYVALLLHDIGKGRDEDHSVIGAQIARKVAPRLGLKRSEVDTVEWLVRYHLLMSDMAQKRDISDPRTVRDFAKAVMNVKRLNLLTVLTVCDIRGVGPGTWNNWKGSLLRRLYNETRQALENGLEDINRENRGAEARKALRAALPDWPSKALKTELGRHYPPYWQGMPTSVHVIFAKLLREIDEGAIRIDLHPDPDRDATRACFALVDHPGLFSRLSGALALVQANVVDARTYTSKDGFATAAFWVQDADGAPYEEERLPRLREMILKTLSGQVVARDAMKSRDKIKKRERAFRVPTTIAWDNEGSEIYTIIEVDTRDRPGLLYDLTRTLAQNNVYIASAVIATYGEQVVDTFYVKDMFGLKFYNEAKRVALDRKLREAITEGAKRAVQG